MQLKALFTTLPYSEFPGERQKAMSFLLKHMNDFLAPYECKGEIANLVELHSREPKLFNQAMKYPFSKAKIPLEYSSWPRLACGELSDPENPLNGLDLVSAWLSDGGDALTGFTSFLQERSSLGIIDALGRIQDEGLHPLLYKFNLKTPSRALDAMSLVVRELFDLADARRPEKKVLDKASIEGLVRDHEVGFSGCEASDLYINLFSKTPENRTSYWIDEAIKKAQSKIDRDISDSHHRLRHILKTFIYNPGLRLLKNNNGDFLEVIQELDPILQGINRIVLTEPYARFSDQDFGVFRRQVYLNLFSPFPEILAAMDANPLELSGNPGLDLGETSRDNPWYMPSRDPSIVMAGPLQTLGNPREIFLYFKRKDLPIDLDWILASPIDFKIFKNLLSLEKRCNTLEKGLERLAQGKGTDADLSFLRQFEFQYKDMELSREAKAGVLVLAALIATDYATSKHVSSDLNPAFFNERLGDHDRYKERLLEDPEMQILVFKCVTLQPNLLHAPCLKWLGFGPEVLSDLDASVRKKAAEGFFAEDLGL